MRTLYRFFQARALRVGELRELDADVSHHLLRVLRVREGAALQLFDGSGREFSAQVTAAAAGRNVECVCVAEVPGAALRESPLPVVLAAAIGKQDKLDMMCARVGQHLLFSLFIPARAVGK